MGGLQLSLRLEADAQASPVDVQTLGEVFTRRWVVDLILDLIGYTAERDLTEMLAVEPACGTGAFLGPMVERLVRSARTHGRDLSEHLRAVRAFDLQPENVERARKLVASELAGAGVSQRRAERLANVWVQQADFLLDVAEDMTADFVIGNPPYIRLEDVPAGRTDAYRRACPTMKGRSDVYVGFIERGLRMLADGGVLGFIVADRWMHNQYGAELRRLVSESFSVEVILEMHDADAFEELVSAYPAITVIRRRSQQKPVVASADKAFGPVGASAFGQWATRSKLPTRRGRGFSAARLSDWFSGSELWPSGDPEAVALVRSLESRFPPLEDPRTGSRVGIGVATGADDAFLTTDPKLVEPSRLLPVAMSEDISSGEVRWSGTHLVNPWDDDGLVDLNKFPQLKVYLQRHRRALANRHIAKVRPHTWYRTIDRVWPHLQTTPKLLLPDMKASIHPVLEPGYLYPHHNLYFVTSSEWDLEVLGGLLLSDIANLFVGTYCVKMRGGCYRFQAQYLRKIRVPARQSLSALDCKELRKSFNERDRDRATDVSRRVFGISELPSSLQKK